MPPVRVFVTHTQQRVFISLTGKNYHLKNGSSFANYTDLKVDYNCKDQILP